MDEIQTKKCSRCKKVKLLDEFYYNKRSNGNGRWAQCKACVSELRKQLWKKNAEKINKARRERYKISPKEIREKAYERICRWAGSNPEKAYAIKARWAKINSKKVKERHRVWRKANSDKIQKYGRKSYAKEYSVPRKRLNRNISSAIWLSLKGNKRGAHWEDLVGYTIEMLKKHLEAQFVNGMTWDNYGQWHIDHRIPKNVFNFTKPEHLDFKRCWMLENLQPLWAKENLEKYTKIDEPFQPSLLI